MIPIFASVVVVLSVLISQLDSITGSFAFDLGSFGLKPWSLLTATLVEQSVLMLVLNGTVFYFMARYFEPRWGVEEMVRQGVVVAVGTNLMMLVFYLVQFGYYESVYGLGSLIFGYLIAFKRAVPEHKVILFKSITIRVKVFYIANKYLPSILFLVQFALYMVGIIRMTFYTTQFGALVSWIYMRYYKVHDGVYGDRSETFSFVSFFPDSFRFHYYLIIVDI